MGGGVGIHQPGILLAEPAEPRQYGDDQPPPTSLRGTVSSFGNETTTPKERPLPGENLTSAFDEDEEEAGVIFYLFARQPEPSDPTYPEKSFTGFEDPEGDGLVDFPQFLRTHNRLFAAVGYPGSYWFLAPSRRGNYLSTQSVYAQGFKEVTRELSVKTRERLKLGACECVFKHGHDITGVRMGGFGRVREPEGKEGEKEVGFWGEGAAKMTRYQDIWEKELGLRKGVACLGFNVLGDGEGDDDVEVEEAYKKLHARNEECDDFCQPCPALGGGCLCWWERDCQCSE